MKKNILKVRIVFTSISHNNHCIWQRKIQASVVQDQQTSILYKHTYLRVLFKAKKEPFLKNHCHTKLTRCTSVHSCEHDELVDALSVILRPIPDIELKLRKSCLSLTKLIQLCNLCPSAVRHQSLTLRWRGNDFGIVEMIPSLSQLTTFLGQS